ncbi:MAG: hypothetical protein HQL13_07330 [Candidatus Omnitrophica bacterium]|nr:hypothetical protein [Candidatus Omnitrophota bacterium]
MKLVKGFLAALVLVGIVGVFTCAYAHEGKNEKNKVKLLNEASEDLAKSNPVLSSQLAEFAKEEAAEKEGKENIGKSKEQIKLHREQHMKLLKDSAQALKAAHPELAKKLTGMANRIEKKLKK